LSRAFLASLSRATGHRRDRNHRVRRRHEQRQESPFHSCKARPLRANVSQKVPSPELL
jgi:hypothetical protein